MDDQEESRLLKQAREPVPRALSHEEQNAARCQCMVVPKRETVIGNDDITNLMIDLGRAKSVAEFEQLIA